jgi:putrescine transport system permease protein
MTWSSVLRDRAGLDNLPLLIWSKVKLGVTPDINALATLMVLAVGIGVVAAGIVMNRAERRRALEERLAYRSND